MELPIAFTDRMRRLLGEDYARFYEALTTGQAVKGIRVNDRKVSTDRLVRFLPFETEAIPYIPNGLIVPSEAHAGKSVFHHAGAYYMQDPGAMATIAALPGELLKQRGLRVLDVCAAPGGKTTQLATACAATGGIVLANEYQSTRSRVLVGNVERMGLSNVCVTNLDSKFLPEWYPSFFDLVVVDAPCSGEGMFRKENPALEEWSLDVVQACAARQKEILSNAEKTVAAGGYLLYSTCTYATEENEEVIAEFLSAHPEFSICSVSEAVAAYTADGVDVTGGRMPSLSLCRRFYPHLCRGEGQFIALLRKECDAKDRTMRRLENKGMPVSANDRAVAETFLRETIGECPAELIACGGKLCLFSIENGSAFPLPPFGVVSCGTDLGEVRKGRLLPHHHFFMSYGTAMTSRLEFLPDSKEVEAYLAGEELVSHAVEGVTAVLVRMEDTVLSLGGGKTVGGRLKNYYPKGLRVRK